MDVEIIQLIPISQTNQPDFWAWQYDKMGIFSVRSAYKMMEETRRRRVDWLEGREASSNVEGEDASWKKLWKLKVPSKLRIFAWRLARSSLPTGEERKRRHMSTTASCPICNAACDSWGHSLLECNMARSVWSLWDEEDVEPLMVDEATDPKLWLMSLSNTLPQRKFVQVLVTLWAIWWARRKAIHEEEFQSPLSTFLSIQNYISEIEWEKKEPAKPGASRNKDAKWLPPDVGFCKINVDGAVAKSCVRGAVGAVCRDERGRFLGASAVVYAGVTDPTMLEAYACKEALELVEDLSQHKLMIASDCLNVINDIRAKFYKGYYCMILRDIEQRRVSFQATKYGHEQREANGEAHRLARMATTLEVARHVWFLDPPDHRCIPINIVQ
jgi:ribonuclease HI